MKLRLALLLSGCVLPAALGLSGDARACGGCFVPPAVQQSGSTVVTGQGRSVGGADAIVTTCTEWPRSTRKRASSGP